MSLKKIFGAVVLKQQINTYWWQPRRLISNTSVSLSQLCGKSGTKEIGLFSDREHGYAEDFSSKRSTICEELQEVQ